MTRFNEDIKTKFDAEAGAYSVVTEREGTGDKSVTLDADEKAVLHQCYGASEITRAGGAPKDGNPHQREFYIYDYKSQNYKLEKLTIKYPKLTGSELRLYFAKEKFYPRTGDTFFIFIRKNEKIPFIGHADKVDWNSISERGEKLSSYENPYLNDVDDAEYQRAIHSPKPPMEGRLTQGFSYERNPLVAIQALKQAQYMCEHNPNHTTFTSDATSNNYMEAHHLIPVAKTKDYYTSLDIAENLVSLCPNCHRQIHLATFEEKKEIIDNLYNKRKKLLKARGLHVTIEEIYEIYGSN